MKNSGNWPTVSLAWFFTRGALASTSAMSALGSRVASPSPIPGTQRKIDEKLVQTGLVVRAPDLFALEDDSVSEYRRTAYLEGRKGASPQKINELLKAQIPVAVEKHERLVAEYVRANKPVFYYNPDFDLASIPRLFIESVEVEGPSMSSLQGTA